MGIVSTIPERCRRCYTCVRECPAKAIKVIAGQATVIEEQCIACGNCVRVCAQHAKKIVNCVPHVESMLHDGSGPLPEILRSLGLWDEGWRAPGHSPIECLDRLGVLSSRTLVVHGVQFGAQDLSKLQARGATLVTCPRSNVRLGVGRTPVPKLLSMGIPVALGTGSLASAGDLDLFAEMASLRSEHPGLSPAAVVRMATLNGARALRLERHLGTIEVGKLAALAVVGIEDPGDDPFEAVTSGPEAASSLA